MQLSYFSAIISGLFISLIGSLPLGNLNMAAMTIAGAETVKRALWFAIGVSVVEIIYLRVTIEAIGWLTKNETIFRIIQWVNVCLLLVLAAGSFFALRKEGGNGRNVLIENKVNRFLLGISMSALNPVQVPFWAGWLTYLFAQNWLARERATYDCFAFSAGAGTMAALLIFIAAGRRFSTTMASNKKKLNIAMMMLFFAMAVFQLVKLL